VLVKSPAGHREPVPITPGARTEEGIVVYRFGTSLYYANAARLLADLRALTDHGGPLQWLVFDCAAIDDIDYTASTVLAGMVKLVQQRYVRFVVSSVLPPVRRQLDRLRHQQGAGTRRLLRESRRGTGGLPRREGGDGRGTG
jgi:sulfate permease, SulP family